MNDVKLSRLMSFILRHRPEEFEVYPDPEGYVPVEELVRALQSRRPGVTRADVERVVNRPEERHGKQRYDLRDGRIRANYGHSFALRIEQERAEPPPVLLHGTAAASLERIRAEGLRPMGRQYVHLVTPERHDIARGVGARHGRALVLAVRALEAHRSGVAFYRANPVFWLADFVPAEFIRFED